MLRGILMTAMIACSIQPKHSQALWGTLGLDPDLPFAVVVLCCCVSMGAWGDSQDLNLSVGRPHGRSGAGRWLVGGADPIVLGRA